MSVRGIDLLLASISISSKSCRSMTPMGTTCIARSIDNVLIPSIVCSIEEALGCKYNTCSMLECNQTKRDASTLETHLKSSDAPLTILEAHVPGLSLWDILIQVSWLTRYKPNRILSVSYTSRSYINTSMGSSQSDHRKLLCCSRGHFGAK